MDLWSLVVINSDVGESGHRNDVSFPIDSMVIATIVTSTFTRGYQW